MFISAGPKITALCSVLWRKCLSSLFQSQRRWVFRYLKLSTRCAFRYYLFVEITYLCFQTDRPSSQYWNSGMVRAHKELAQEFNVSITHISEQSCHNKVCWNKTYFPDEYKLSFLGLGRWGILGCQDSPSSVYDQEWYKLTGLSWGQG